MKYKIETGSIWEFGQRKDEQGNPHQEDSIFPAHCKSQPSDRLFILCDGMGGHAAGEVASATVCEAMSKSLLPLKPNFAESNISTAVTAAYDALDAIDNNAEGKNKMGTTMTCLVLHGSGVTIAHMGDSRVYHIRPGKEREDTEILFQTRDHSLVNDLVSVGEITPEEAKTHPRKNVITRALQPHVENRQQADIRTTNDIKPGDWFYLCSDGMLEQMDDSAIRFIFSDATGGMDKKLEMLTLATRENRDNHTAYLIHILDVERPQPVQKESSTLPPLMGNVEDVEEKQNSHPTPTTENQAKYPVSPNAGDTKTDSTPKPSNISTDQTTKSNSILIGVLAALVLLAGAWYFGAHKKDADKANGNENTTVAMPNGINPNDTAPKGDTVTYAKPASKQAGNRKHTLRRNTTTNIAIIYNGRRTIIKLN